MKKNKSDKFLKLIDKHKEKKKTPRFHGTLSEYLKLIEENKSIAKLSHKRLYDVIEGHGITKMNVTDERCNKLFNGSELRTYDYFQKKFFGMERSLAKVMRFLRSASLKGEESRQVLLLLGPVGAGKSALAEHIKSVSRCTILRVARFMKNLFILFHARCGESSRKYMDTALKEIYVPFAGSG